MELKRRYPDSNETQSYHIHFNRRRDFSDILTPGNIDLHSVPNDRRNVESLIIEKVGNGDGRYNLPGQKSRLAALPSIEKELGDLEEKFQKSRQKSINEGRMPFEKYPIELQNKKHRLEAEQDVIESELIILRQILSRFTDEEDDRKRKLMLRYGPYGNGQLKGGFLSEIDRQRVEPNEDGVLIITEKSSPYRGMRSIDYYALVCKPWRKASAKLKKEMLKITNGRKGNQLSEVERQQVSSRRDELFEQFPEWENLFVKMMPDRPRMPRWPARCIDHTEQEKPAAELVRTKQQQRNMPVSNK